MRPLTAPLLLAIAISLSSPAKADNMGMMDGNDWLRLSFAERAGFVMGVYEKSLMPIGGVAWTGTFADGLMACRAELSFSAYDVAVKTTKAYERPDDRILPAYVVVNSVLNKLCRKHIEAANAKHGLQ